MTPGELLAVVKAAGIILQADGGRLTYDAPKGALTAELRDQLVRHKTDLLVLLAPPRAFVTLRNGPTLPIESIELAIALEARGISLRTDADHQFIVPTDPRLTDVDRAAIQRWRHHLGCIVEYVAPEVG